MLKLAPVKVSELKVVVRSGEEGVTVTVTGAVGALASLTVNGFAPFAGMLRLVGATTRLGDWSTVTLTTLSS